MIDRQAQVYEHFDAEQRGWLRDLITDELIEEHRTNPVGQHSDALERVLQYFRRLPTAGKHVVVMTRPWSDYRVGIWPARREDRVKILEDETYSTENEARHAVFLMRIRELERS